MQLLEVSAAVRHIYIYIYVYIYIYIYIYIYVIRQLKVKRSRHTCKDNITTHEEEIKWETVEWTHTAQDRIWSMASLQGNWIFGFHHRQGIFLQLMNSQLLMKGYLPFEWQ